MHGDSSDDGNGGRESSGETGSGVMIDVPWGEGIWRWW